MEHQITKSYKLLSTFKAYKHVGVNLIVVEYAFIFIWALGNVFAWFEGFVVLTFVILHHCFTSKTFFTKLTLKRCWNVLNMSGVMMHDC